MTARTATCAAPQLLIAFEFSAMTISISALAADLGIPARAVPLVFAAYSLAFGSLLLAWGRAVDRLGAKPCLIAGLTIFSAGLAGGAAAPSAGVLVASRVVAGAGAAAMAPASLAATTAAFPAADRRRNALSWYAAAITVGFVLGALVAGLLGQLLGWRAAVASTSVIAALALIATTALPGGRRRLPGSRRGGTVRVTLVAGGLSLALCASTTGLLPPAIAVACALPALGLVGSAPARHMPLITAGAAVTATGVTGTLLLSLYLREARSFTPLGTAVLFAAFGLTAFAGRRLARTIAAGRGEPPVLGAGLLFQGLALVLIALAAAAHSPISILALCISAFGLAHTVANAGVALWTAATPEATHGTVAAFVATAQYFGGAIGPLTIGSLVADHGAGIAIAGAVAAVAGAVALLWSGEPGRFGPRRRQSLPPPRDRSD